MENLDWIPKNNAINVETESEFHERRSQGIGSSDIPIILGLSPYKTIFKLWQEKTKLIKDDFKGNFATERGKRLEPKIRDWFNITHKFNMEPENRVHANNPIFRASCDGVDHEHELLIEIKAPCKEDHELALAGTVPTKYYPQCQWLMMVFGYDALRYISYNEGCEVKFADVTLRADYKYHEMMKEKALEFWKLVETKTPPESDEEEINNPEAIRLLQDYELLKKQEQDVKERLNIITEQLGAMLTKTKAVCQDYKLSWVTRKGTIDYDKIPNLKHVDLEQFRKKGSTYFTIKRTSEKR
jgi:putative phage-type endonuclease